MLSLAVVFVMFTLIRSDDSCTYYNQSSIDIIVDQNIGNMYIRTIMEISFDLQIHEVCHGYCHIFAISPRVPLMYTKSNELFIQFVTETIYTKAAYPIIVDGDYHTLYYKFSATDRILTVDGITYVNITNDSYDYSDNYIYTTQEITTVWANPTGYQYAYNGTIRNLCIKSVFPKPSPTANVQSQSELMLYLEDIRQHNETVYFYNHDPYLPTYWSKNVGNYGIILSSSTADIAYYHIGDIVNNTITLYYNDLIVCKTQNDPYITYQSALSENCTFNVIFESNSTVLLQTVNELYLSRIRYQSTDYLWSHHNESLIYSQFILYSTLPLPTNDPSKSPSSYPSKSPNSYPSNTPTMLPTNQPTDYGKDSEYQENTIYSTLSTLLTEVKTRDSVGNSNDAVLIISMVISCVVLVLLILACSVMYKIYIYKRKNIEKMVVAINHDSNVDSGRSLDNNGVRKQTDSHNSMYGVGNENDNEENGTITIDGEGNTQKGINKNRNESEIEDMYNNNNIVLTPDKETMYNTAAKEMNVNEYIQEDQDESGDEDIDQTTQCPTPCEGEV